MASQPQTIHLKDYKPKSYKTKTCELYFNIGDKKTTVESKLLVEKLDDREPLILYGVDLKLIEIKINGNILDSKNYTLHDEKLEVHGLKDKETTIEIKVEINPFENLSLEGLYQSGEILCTQNEPEGFRKITYFQDHPDNLTIYTTTIEANKKKYPYLLSNGNKIKEETKGDRHLVTFHDPFPKPSYLFALVAGDLALVKDTFTTMSGRKINLEIYVDHGNEDKCDHAMRSLQNAMKWDEVRFGLEYDLDTYMIVAVDSFNMGAMENKGLNIFNSAYVLAKKETATDANFEGIEGVIGHEYFHNWTGNRVTCRDWFQLTLKEGLTVFRDQEFSSDMLSRPVKRIDDVKRLRAHQFPEDAGPLAHPIKPKSYIEVNNFYTATVYEKGAEVIRMVETIIGRENFRKGLELYFKRYDGMAVTTEDFISSMEDASGVDLEQFKLWYDQVGTPTLKVKEEFDHNNKEYKITLKQNEKEGALVMPLLFGLISKDGREIKTSFNNLILFNELEKTYIFKDLEEKPLLSLNRNFSSPIKVVQEKTEEELALLLEFDQDPFNRFDFAQTLYYKQLEKIRKGEAINESFFKAYASLLKNALKDPSYSSYILDLPSLNDLNETQEIVDYKKNNEILKALKNILGNRFKNEFYDIYRELSKDKEFILTSKAMGKRALLNLALKYLSFVKEKEIEEIVWLHFNEATNMTNEIGGLGIIVHSSHPKKQEALKKFYNKWKHESLVIQKWFSLQATIPDETVLDQIGMLMKLPEYDERIPNVVRSVVHQFAMNNSVILNHESGIGYEFIADEIIKIDKYNPQLASRLAKTLSHRRRLSPLHKEKLDNALTRILKEKLSNDTFEVVSQNLKA